MQIYRCVLSTEESEGSANSPYSMNLRTRLKMERTATTTLTGPLKYIPNTTRFVEIGFRIKMDSKYLYGISVIVLQVGLIV